MSGVNGSFNNRTLYQQDWDLNNGNASSGNGFTNSHTLSQCDYLSTFKDMDLDVENDDVSSGYGSMNSHTVYQNNGLNN